MASRAPLLLLLLACVGCAARLRSIDAAGGTCVLSDGREGPWVPARVKSLGAHPRLAKPVLEDAPAPEGVYDCGIGQSGEVQRCRVLQSIPEGDGRALGALATWGFSPATCAGVPVSSRLTLTLAPAFIPPCTGSGAVSALAESADSGPPAEKAKRLQQELGSTTAFAVLAGGDRCATSDGREGLYEPPRETAPRRVEYGGAPIERLPDGRVVATCVVRSAGRYERCRIRCSDVPALEGAVLDAMGRWEVEGARCGGEPADVLVDVPVVYRHR